METLIGKNIEYAAELILKGEIVGIPTETVYGLAANALNEEAVIKVFEAKKRPELNPLIIHLPYIEQALNYVEEIPLWMETLADIFSPGPLTFLANKKPIIPDLVTGGLPKVAFRIPNEPLTHHLLNLVSVPLAAPSANQFTSVSPTSAEHVKAELEGKIHYILDGGPSKVGVESTIVDEENGEIIIRRPGGISLDDILEALNHQYPVRYAQKTEKIVAPGSHRSHYATKAPLYLVDSPLQLPAPGSHNLVIGFGTSVSSKGFNLSPDGNLHEAAGNLFSFMRRADELAPSAIYVAKMPGKGIGIAMNDRLFRAQASQK